MSTPTDIITRCPQCSVAFRATAQILKIANGNVRCGSCLNVFNAAEHVVDQGNTSNGVDPAVPESITPELKAPETKKSEVLFTASASTDSLAGNKDKTKNNATLKDDESWALDLLAEEKIAEENGQYHFEIGLDAYSNEPPENQAFFDDIINNDLNLDSNPYSDLEKPFEDLDDAIHLDDSITLDVPSELDDNHDQDLLEDIAIDLDYEESTIEQSLSDDDNEALLDEITLQPYDDRPPSRTALWGFGAFCLCLMLTLQIAWVRHETLSQQEPYRSYYQYACELLECSLPLQSDIQQIQTSHLAIRSHPNENNTLVADAIIVNQAPFEQAFPALQLEFRDINNTLVAQRNFQPAEYLKGELLGATIMPAQQAVQLSLAIIDPGENALNYRINIIPASDH